MTRRLGCLVTLLWAGVAHAGTAIVGATVYTLEADQAQPREGVTVLVADGRVQAVGPDPVIPDGYQRIDATGRIVTPGLIESHSQLGLVEIAGEPSTRDASVGVVAFASTGATGVERFRFGPAFDVQYAINPNSTLLPVNRMDGVTRAVVAPLPGNDPLAGWGAAIRLDDAVGVQPRLALFGSIGAATAAYTGGSRSALIQRLREGLDGARSFRPDRYQPDAGAYTRREMSALKAFLDAGVPLVLTVHRANEIRQALAMAREFEFPLVIHGGSEAWQVAHTLARHRVPVIVDVLDNLPVSYDQLGARLDNAVLLQRAGVPVLLTAEETQNARLLRQIAGNAVAEGMPWADALAAVTAVPARVFGLPAGTGTLGPGAPADLVVWTDDPFELTTWAERVMIDGEWIPMTSRQTRLLERYRDLEGPLPFGYR
ncbi:MAG: amidohydrolase family protein [Pseudomonadales bacterium]